ncbi:MAG: sigma-70 family RNA polymerase sigma factor [Verrucomicrobiales bacterium]|nr:sigma-70 family RNA polymerase sigma factor [Verrucomicrobiales bacterium]
MKEKNKTSSIKHRLNPDTWTSDYRDYLVNFANKKVSDHGIAEDLVQDTFLSAWVARERFRGACSERTWLIGVLKNKIIDHYRKTARRPQVNETDLEMTGSEQGDFRDKWLDQHAVASDRFDPAKNTERHEFIAQLDAGMELLPDLSAKVFVMREIQGLSTDEITRALNISKSNLWVLIHRAKSGLQKHFNAVWEEERIAA